ncbi:hypothetical protein BAW75_07275 [Micromonospora chalcea]|nr:hypothetical protein BAW75_07275 [Micromonospora chalcea]
MIVVQMFRIGAPTDRAHAALLGQELLELLLPDPVAAAQVVLAIATVEPLLRLVTAGDVARLAVAVPTAGVGRSGEIVNGLDLLAVGAPLEAVRYRHGSPSLRRDATFPATRL